MHWKLKGGIQKALGYVPSGGRIHYELQRRFGGLSHAESECLERIDEWILLVKRLRKHRIEISGQQMLEMGTGYYPAFPLCMYVAGARHVFTLDMTRHLRQDLTLLCAELIAKNTDRLRASVPSANKDLERRAQSVLEQLRRDASIADATDGCVEYQAPADASQTNLPESSVDVVFSNNVLEHVPPGAISACLNEARRILRPKGWVAHQVDCGDHYADVDTRIHKYNYLAWSESQWRLWNNQFLYQNRLRRSDFRRLAEHSGFEVYEHVVTPGELERRQLATTRIASEFSHYDTNDLLITNFALLGQRPG